MDERNELDLQAELLSFHEAERFPSVSLDSSDCSVTFSLHFQRLGKVWLQWAWNQWVSKTY